MTSNVLKNYITLTKNEINSYMKLIFESRYIKRISDEYIKAYLNVRFYNFYVKDENLTFRKNFINAIKQAEQSILNKYPDDKKIIENMGMFYCVILYFDRISYRVNIEDNVEKLYKLRKKILNKDNEDFKTEFLKTYQEYLTQKTEFLQKFDSEDFELKITDYSNSGDVHKVILKHNIKFPMIYSSAAIQKTFDTGITNEDKLNVEYSLISVNVLRDLIRGNFRKQYIVEFAPTLLKKSKKLKSILNIISNPAIQDKINFKIHYKEFAENKDKIYELMREGYRFAIVVDDTMDTTYGTLQKLNAFSYIIVSSRLIRYNEIMENKIILKNIIEI